jgi:hypothetical protein
VPQCVTANTKDCSPARLRVYTHPPATTLRCCMQLATLLCTHRSPAAVPRTNCRRNHFLIKGQVTCRIVRRVKRSSKLHIATGQVMLNSRASCNKQQGKLHQATRQVASSNRASCIKQQGKLHQAAGQVITNSKASCTKQQSKLRRLTQQVASSKGKLHQVSWQDASATVAI